MNPSPYDLIIGLDRWDKKADLSRLDTQRPARGATTRVPSPCGGGQCVSPNQDGVKRRLRPAGQVAEPPGKAGRSHYGEMAQVSPVTKVERNVLEELAKRKWDESALGARRKGDPVK